MAEVILDIFEGAPPLGNRLAWPVPGGFHARIIPVRAPSPPAEVATSETGVWIDAAGEVVTNAPAEGVQLVPPGGVLSAAVLRAIEDAGGLP